MRISYKILLIRDDSGKITSAWQPDLRIMFSELDESPTANVLEIITKRLQDYIAKQDEDNIEFLYPQKFDADDEEQDFVIKKPNDIWTQIFVNVAPRKKFAENVLPVIGTSAVIVNALCVSLATFVSIGIAVRGTESATEDDEFHRDSKLAIAGAIFNLILTILIYYYSDTRNELTIFGRRCDNLFFSKNKQSKNERFIITIDSENNILIKKENHLTVTDENNWKSTALLTTSRTLFLSLTAGDTLASATTAFQEISSLGARAAKTNQNLSPGLIQTWALTFAISNAIAWGTFNANFLNKGAIMVANYLKLKLLSGNQVTQNESNNIVSYLWRNSSHGNRNGQIQYSQLPKNNGTASIEVEEEEESKTKTRVHSPK